MQEVAEKKPIRSSSSVKVCELCFCLGVLLYYVCTVVVLSVPIYNLEPVLATSSTLTGSALAIGLCYVLICLNVMHL